MLRALLYQLELLHLQRLDAGADVDGNITRVFQPCDYLGACAPNPFLNLTHNSIYG